MVRRARARSLLAASVLMVGVFAMSAAAAVPEAKTVSASAWVKAVCGAETKLNSLVSPKLKAVNTALSSGDATGAKAAFVAFVDALPGPTKTLLSSLRKAGVPKITNGKKIAQLYLSTDEAVAKALPGMKKQAAALPTSDVATFKTAGEEVVNKIKTPTEAATNKIQTLDTDQKVNTPLTDCGGVYAAGGGSGQSSGNQGSSGPTQPTGAPANRSPSSS